MAQAVAMAGQLQMVQAIAMAGQRAPWIIADCPRDMDGCAACTVILRYTVLYICQVYNNSWGDKGTRVDG